jgi:hypothetical protein
MAPWFVGVADLEVDMYVGVYSLGGGPWELVTIVREGARCRPDSAGKVCMGAFGTYVFGAAVRYVSILLAVTETGRAVEHTLNCWLKATVVCGRDRFKSRCGWFRQRSQGVGGDCT